MDGFIPYRRPHRSDQEMQFAIETFYRELATRRSVREFSARHIPKSVIELILATAASAPSGAHKQPWSFCAVSSPEIKSQIRQAAEAEERENYTGRMSESWLKDLEPFDTNWKKPFLEIAPWLIVVFKRAYDITTEGEKKKNYYVNESVGIATGFLLAAIHQAGLVALTHTPSPMSFLERILKRPENERAFLLIPVGHPHEDATVPDLVRKQSSEVVSWYE